MHSVWQAVKHSVTSLRTIGFIALLAAATLLPMLSDPGIARADMNNTRADAWGTLELGGGSWLGGNGVGIYSNGSQVTYTPNKPNNSVGGVTSGEEWQCVEMVNRLYLTEGWTSSTWVGSGNTLINSVPSGLTSESNGHISYISPGDVITLDDGGYGHAGIINTTGSSYQIVNQNTVAVYSSASIDTGSFSAKNAHLIMSGWAGYSVQAIVHHPGSSGAAPTQQDVAWFQGSTLWTFTGPNLNVSGSSGFSSGAWNGVGDYNRDGHDDLFLYNSSNDTLYWMSSDGHTLGKNGIGTVRTNMGGPPGWAAVGDFDGDGYRNDIIWFKGSNLYTFEMKMVGQTYSLVQTGVVTGFHAPTWGGVGDFNHDGKDDLVMYDGPSDSLVWMSSDGSAVGAQGLGTLKSSMGGGPDWAGVGNFTGTGFRDSVAYFRGATLYTFTWPGLQWTGTANYYAPTWAGVSDHDGDGKDDLLLYNGSAQALYWVSSDGTGVGEHGLGFIRGYDIGAPAWAGVGKFTY